VTLLAIAVPRIPVELDPVVRWVGFAVVALAICIAAFWLHRRATKRGRARTVEARPPGSDPTHAPYRGALARRAARIVAPPISGRLAALVVASTLAATAGVLPTLLELPRWIESELVVASWWLVWFVAFAVLLFRGFRLAGDLRIETEDGLAPARPETKDGEATARRPRWSRLDLPDLGAADAEGCAVLVGVALALLVALLLAWLIVELLFPALLLAVYWLILRGLTRVANDTHGCEGRLFASILWGGIWATLYTAPLAFLVWLAHLILGGHG
jgi:hypothetical protein